VAAQPAGFAQAVEVVAMDGFAGYKTAAAALVPDAVTVISAATPSDSATSPTTDCAHYCTAAHSTTPSMHSELRRAVKLVIGGQVSIGTGWCIEGGRQLISCP
jgi:hypothetical protein